MSLDAIQNHRAAATSWTYEYRKRKKKEGEDIDRISSPCNIKVKDNMYIHF
jgi:hypothetical protein